MANWTRRGFLGSLSGVAAATSLVAQQTSRLPLPEKRTGHGSIKITDLKCAVIGNNPVVRIVTDPERVRLRSKRSPRRHISSRWCSSIKTIFWGKTQRTSSG